MKQHFSKLLALLLTASLCIPTFSIENIQAAGTDTIIWSEEETIPVNGAISEERSSNFNEGWKFYLGDSNTAQNTDFIDSSWTDINLPHDFSISQDFISNGEAESGFLPGGTGWYRKKFTLPDSLKGKSIVLNFDGVYSDAYVYVNGTQVGEHHYGYTSFAFDISSYLHYDNSTENVIAVKAVNRIPSSRWYSGSGIYRDVTLIVTDPVHVAQNGTYVTTPNLQSSNGSDGTVKIAVDVQNDSTSAATVTVRNTIFEKNSTEALVSAEKSVVVSAGKVSTVETSPSVSNPKLWSIEEPNLYYVRTEILNGTTVLDTYDTEFGFKWYEFVNNVGFKLNGTNVKLNGVCMHHDQGALGSAAYYDAMYRQLMTMKDMGANAIRITHNPGAEIYVDICNQIGLLVIEEAFDGWAWPKNGNSYDFSAYFSKNLTADNKIIDGNSSMTWAEFVLKSMIKRDRNDASVILWSLGNEIQEGTSDYSSWDWGGIADNLITWANQVDSSHPLTSGSNRKNTTDNVAAVMRKIVQNGGIAGYNYASESELASLHNTYGCIIASETASAINSRGIYMSQSNGGNADGKYHLTSYDTSKVGWGKTAQESLWDTLPDYIAGQFVWTGFDYIGEPTPWNGTGSGNANGGASGYPNSSYFGIVETTGFPKDSYYLYRSQWNQSDTTLHLVTAWDSDNMLTSSGKTPVMVYSNAHKIELYRTVNGTSTKIGTATRTVNTTAAGHKYYTYTTESNNTSICTAVKGSNASSLYAAFNVSFASGTISAKAYDEKNQEITQTAIGTKSISTPGTVSKLSASSDKKTIDADGCSLAYISVDVTDAAGNLKTTATNTIQFTLTGNGEIVGVDNGDQATKDKYQQKSVLKSTTSASINAYAGKALVIVRSTKDGGSFTVNATSNGLSSSSVTVTTEEKVTEVSDALQSYTLKRHCYIPIGTADITDSLPKTVTASYADGSTKALDINWEAYDQSKLNQKGSFQINGSITDREQTVNLFITAHVYQDIAGVQGFSLCTAPNTIPTLPTVSMAYDSDGSQFMEFPVTWDTKALTADSFAKVNTVVSITGTVTVFGTDYPTKATVRVADPDVTYVNVAKSRARLTDNGLTNGSNGTSYNDVLNSITDGKRLDTGESDSRWSDWSNKNVNKRQDDIQIAMNWDTVTTTDRIDIYYFISDNPTDSAASAFPDKVTIQYAGGSQYNSATGMIEAQWEDISYTESEIEVKPTDLDKANTSNTVTFGKSYQLEKLINPQAIRIIFGHAANKFIGLNEIEVMSPSYSYTMNSSAALTGASIGNETITFQAQQTEYYVNASAIDSSKITFNNPENAAITLIQQNDITVKIITVSEDGKDTKTYTITVNPKQALSGKLDEYKNEIDETELKEDFEDLDSYSNLKDLIDEVKNSMTEDMDEETVQKKLEELEDAYQEFYTDALDQKLDEYRNLDKTEYTPESYKELQDLIADIEKKDLTTMTGAELKTQLNSLKSAFAALAKPVPPTPPAITSPGPDIPVVTPPNPVITPPGPNTENKDVLTLNDKITVGDVEYQVVNVAAQTVAAVKLTNKKATKITIQDTVTIKKIPCRVVKINDKVFQNAAKLKTVKLGKYVTVIGKNAFTKCKKLKTITFQETNVTIGKGAFKKAKSGITVKGTKKLKGKKKTAFKKKLTKAGMKNPKLK